MKKRDFIKTASLALGAAVLPLSTWSCENPESILRTAHIGVSNMGLEDLKAISSHANVVVTALCDVDSNALKAANEMFPKAQIFKDYRAMFDQISDQIDAVIVSTPDHTHAPASLLAMEKNKAVYCQKPLTHFVSESREMRKVANEKNLVTQMGIQVHSFYDYKLATSLILWLGTSKERPYKDEYYHPGNWRKLMDYGCATLGDMGVHIFDTPYNALELDVPNTITNECRPFNGYGYPERNIVRYTFDGTAHTTDSFEWLWYDGVDGPNITDELVLPEGEKLPGQGAMFIGEDGKRLLLPHFMELPKLIEEESYKTYDIASYDPENTLGEPIRDYASESPKHYHEFVDTCLGKSTCSAPFEYASRLTETILLGVIAGRFPNKTLNYNKETSEFIEEEANEFLKGDQRVF